MQGNESSADNEFVRSDLCLRVLATSSALADQFAVAVQHSPRAPGNLGFISSRSPVLSFPLLIGKCGFASAFVRCFGWVYHIGVCTTKMMIYTASTMILLYTQPLSLEKMKSV